MSVTVPTWALKKATELAAECAAYPSWPPEHLGGHWAIAAFAHYIAQHEDPPVDPRAEAAKSLAEKWAPEMVTPYPPGRLDALKAMAAEAIGIGLELGKASS